MSERERLLKQFDELPVLLNQPLSSSPFCFPERSDPSGDLPQGNRTADTSMSLRPEASRASGAISDLRDTIRDAAGKTKFGQTSIDQWERIMQFSGSKTRRRSRSQRFEIIRSDLRKWHRDEPINISAPLAKDWFNRVLLQRIKEGGNYRHSHAILGDQGCGKSTLIKYLISTNAPECRSESIVFSRFEFLKFWADWRQQGQGILESLSAYMSFIHLRDLLLDHFFTFDDGNRYTLKLPFQLSENRNHEIEVITKAIINHNNTFDDVDDRIIRMTVTECVETAREGNHDLMTYIKGLPHDRRLAIIRVLWDEKYLVTVFDGLDSLKIEDAFQQTEQWEAIQEIIRNRAWLSMPTRFLQQGIALQNDSIIVIRKSTAALLELQAKSTDAFGLQHYYHVAPIDSRAAMVSVIRRALDNLDDYEDPSQTSIDQDTFKLMKVVQRTMVAIGRSEGGAAALDDIYNLFDGNLRDLFTFVSDTIVWTCQEMLKSKYLDHNDYFDQVPTLIDALASYRGSEFLNWKSYRVVEQILLGYGKSFENEAVIVKAEDTMLRRGGASSHVRTNPDHRGQIDNIFNYLTIGDAAPVDRHALLEKIRLAQLMWYDPVQGTDIPERMRELFGAEPSDDYLLLVLMLKTGILSAEIARGGGGYRLFYRTTPKAKLCINSLIGNLSYLENVFHQTLFPEVLVGHISDKVRDESTLDWAIASIRNAFVFLTYFKHIEKNAADGIAVPDHLQLFEEVRRRVGMSLDRMTKALVRTDYAPLDRKESDRAIRAREEAKKICKGALEQIDATMSVWKEAGVISDAR